MDDLIPSIYDEVNEDEYQAKRADCRQFVENDSLFFYSIGVSKRRFCVFKRIKLIKLFILDGIAYDDTDSDRSGDDNESLPREKKAKKGKITDLIQGRK